MNLENLITKELEHHLLATTNSISKSSSQIQSAGELITNGFKFQPRKKLFLFGNGGSAADAQHITAEFTNRYSIDRIPLPAIALTTDTSAITAISNDFGYNQIFEKQLKALANEGDTALGISTSGKSENVINGLNTANSLGLKTILLTGNNKLNYPNIDIVIKVDSKSTPRIQEVHILIGHILCQIVDESFKNMKVNKNRVTNKKGQNNNKRSSPSVSSFKSISEMNF